MKIESKNKRYLRETREKLTDRKWKYQNNMNLLGTGRLSRWQEDFERQVSSQDKSHLRGEEMEELLGNKLTNISLISYRSFLYIGTHFLMQFLLNVEVCISGFTFLLLAHCAVSSRPMLVLSAGNKETCPAALASPESTRPH